MDRVNEAYRTCTERVRKAGSSFYYGMRLLPASKRSAVYAVYAWSRMCDDAVDDYAGEAAHTQLAEAETVYEEARSPGWQEAANPVSVALGDALRRFHLSDEPFRALIRGMRMDLESRTYRTFQELEAYCLNVAGSIGTLCIEVFGFTDERARQLAAKLGIALQLTNILRDLKEDASRGRCYLPHEDFEAAGLQADEVALAEYSPALVRVLAMEAQRADRYYDQASELFTMVQQDSVRCLRLLYGVYYLILQKIKEVSFDVWETRIGVSNREALHIVGEAFWQANA